MIICVINLLMLQLRIFCRKCRISALFFVANDVITRFFCRKCHDYALFGVEFWHKFWQKFLEILRILAEILRKKLACGASDHNCVLTALPTLSTGVPFTFTFGNKLSNYNCLMLVSLFPHSRVDPQPI